MCSAEITFKSATSRTIGKTQGNNDQTDHLPVEEILSRIQSTRNKKGRVFKPARRNLRLYSTLRSESSSPSFSTAASRPSGLLMFLFSNSTVSPALRRSKTSPAPSAKSRGPSMCCSPIRFCCLEYLLVARPSRARSKSRRGRKPIWWFDRARFLLSSRHAFPQLSKLGHESLPSTKFLPGHGALESDHLR
jgi:hypothetical protein